MEMVSTLEKIHPRSDGASSNNQYDGHLHKADTKKNCSACAKEILTGNFISWEFMIFCDEECINKYQKGLSTKCSNCPSRIQEASFGKYYQRLKNCFALFCSKSCLVKYGSSVKICSFCEKVKPEGLSDWIVLRLRVTCMLSAVIFCSQNCYKKFVEMTKGVVLEIPEGTYCGVCQTNSISIVLEHEQNKHFFCSKKCLTAFSYVQLVSGTEECSMCKKFYSSNVIDEHRVRFDNEEFRFCSNTCKNVFVFSNRKLMLCAWCQSSTYNNNMVTRYSTTFPLVISFCSTNCLKKYQISKVDLKKCSVSLLKLPLTLIKDADEPEPKRTRLSDARKEIFVPAALAMPLRNVGTMCSVLKANRGITVKPTTSNKGLQTDKMHKTLLPVPLPIYVPTPMAMYSLPVPFAVPIPIPIPVPIFIPTSRNTAKGITKEIEKIRNRTPINPYEAELLKIADMLSGSEVQNNSDSETEPVREADVKDMELCEGALENNFDLEWALPDSVTPIKPEVSQEMQGKKDIYEEGCMSNTYLDKSSDMRLDFTLGINAWKQWVLKTHGTKKEHAFKPEILAMSPKEFSEALCLFIKELRKPNGEEYAPDTIYYLCLGIQYYLDENGKVDNIFHDEIYEKFTDRLDELAIKFCALYDDESHFIITRVEEEHLWETRQLGCHSPYILLNTLIYFNTKYYFRSTVDEHMELSFYHVMKTHRKNSKSVNMAISLRFYPVSKSNTERIYEQQEDREDPLRCPVKLYEFYVSKCPEAVKNKFDMMYLKPEKHCISDSPLWYTSEALPRQALAKIVNRVKMVKEINVALLGNNN
ncbi:hypothetical protein JTB14_018837 [Gonioctena quinquepunctata]|nr:hypothetical protein JTB14_018837 [Gonioctena quinquepunctata]